MNSNYLFSVFDVINTIIFCRRINAKSFNILFLNSVAHLQHNYWDVCNLGDNIDLTIQNLDSILGMLYIKFEGQPIVVCNAFRQVNTSDKSEFLYRQISPDKFLLKTGLKYKKTGKLMTNDSHLFFESESDMEAAYKILSNSTINNKEVFDVQKDMERGTVFFQFKLWDNFNDNDTLDINGKRIKFFEIFKKVVKRTGSHVCKGDIFFQGINIPDKIENHELFFSLENHYKAEQ